MDIDEYSNEYKEIHALPEGIYVSMIIFLCA